MQKNFMSLENQSIKSDKSVTGAFCWILRNQEAAGTRYGGVCGLFAVRLTAPLILFYAGRYGSKTFDIFFTAGIVDAGVDKKLLSPVVA